MAAVLIGLAVGIEPAALREGVRAFAPMPHRLQPVAEHRRRPLRRRLEGDQSGLGRRGAAAYDRPIVLIAGGKSKGTDFAELGAAIAARAKALVAHRRGGRRDRRGRAASRPRARSPWKTRSRCARTLAEPGDVILLSPACASFDMFDSAEDRGDAVR